MAVFTFRLQIKDSQIPDRQISFELKVPGYNKMTETDKTKMKRRKVVQCVSADYGNHSISDCEKIESWIADNWDTINAIFYEKLYENKK